MVVCESELFELSSQVRDDSLSTEITIWRGVQSIVAPTPQAHRTPSRREDVSKGGRLEGPRCHADGSLLCVGVLFFFGSLHGTRIMAGIDDTTKATVQKLPMLTVNAGPRDGDEWVKRMKEEYTALIQVCQFLSHATP